MCGIAGEFALEREQVTAAARRMISALRHRGPDSSGHYLSPARNVLLVNTRLAIVDIGGGTQPLANEDGSVRITFNGEIYGFATLARQLESRGHRLRTRCDTEVIVHLYEEYDRVVELFGAYPYPALRALKLGRWIRNLLSRETIRSIGDFDPLEQLATRWSSRRLAGDDPLSATQDFLFRTQLPSYILNCLGDRMEMANSVEGRVPFLDHKLAEFAFGLPRSLKVRNGQGKVLLREALGQSHPAYRVAKKAFFSPAATLDVRNGQSPLNRYLDRRVTEACGIFNPVRLRTLKHALPFLRKGSNRRVRCESLLTFAISVHALHELFCSNFKGSMQRFERQM